MDVRDVMTLDQEGQDYSRDLREKKEGGKRGRGREQRELVAGGG